MSKFKITVLTPIHISSGIEYEKNFNLLEDNGFVYFYDEFKIAEFFVVNNIHIPNNLDRLKKLISDNKNKIIASNLHIRKIESKFTKLNKPILEQISSNYIPIIPGSSIKGSIRTAILDCLANKDNICNNIQSLLKQKKDFKERLDNNGRVPYDKDLAEIFKYLKVSDSTSLLETQIIKTINVKKDKSHQKARENKVEEISNYVEAIKPNQTFEIDITDISKTKIFNSLATMCNKYYIPFFQRDLQYYFTKDTKIKEKALSASKNKFILNIGRFSGAESKSINNLRYIKASKASDKSTTTARTFALEEATNDKIYFENKLLPFGWIMCEKIDTPDFKQNKIKKDKILDIQTNKYKAIDTLRNIKKIEEEKLIKKQQLQQTAKEEEARKKAEEEAKRKAKLASMTPVQRLIEEYGDMSLLINDMKLGKIENFEEIKVELAKEIKKILQQNPKTWDKAKKKALDRKNYIESIING